MAEKVANIAKNTSYFTFALILQKVISFAYFTILARNLGPDDLGKYYFAISFASVFGIFMDIGLANVLTRESAKDIETGKKYLSQILGIKLVLSFITSIAIFNLINALGYSALIKSLVYVSTVSVMLDSFTFVFYAYVRGFHNLKYESISSVIFQLIMLVLGLFVLYAGWPLLWQMAALALASLYNLVFSLTIAVRIFKAGLSLRIDIRIAKTILKIAAPFAVYAILQRFFTYFDQLLLSKLAGTQAVGLYQVPFKIIFALQFLPMAFTASLYPAMSVYWKNNRSQLAITFERAMNYLTIISLPIAIGIIVLSDRIALIFKSGFSGSILPLELAMIGLVFIFTGFPIGSLLNACDRQGVNTRNMGITLILSVLLNLILIPEWGAAGASLTATISNGFLVLIGLFSARRVAAFRISKIGSVALKSLASALLMAFIIYLAKSYLPLPILILIGGIVYFWFLFITRAFTKYDLLSIRSSLKL